MNLALRLRARLPTRDDSGSIFRYTRSDLPCGRRLDGDWVAAGSQGRVRFERGERSDLHTPMEAYCNRAAEGRVKTLRPSCKRVLLLRSVANRPIVSARAEGDPVPSGKAPHGGLPEPAGGGGGSVWERGDSHTPIIGNRPAAPHWGAGKWRSGGMPVRGLEGRGELALRPCGRATCGGELG